MVDLDSVLQPVFADSPEPDSFARIRARAAKVRRRRLLRIGVGAVAIIAMSTVAVAAIAARDHHDTMTVINPPTTPTGRLEIGTPTRVSQYGIDMLSAFGSMWVSLPDHVARFDPTTGHLTATITVPGTSDFRNLAAGAGSIWVDDTGTETVTRIDPARNLVAATIPVPDKVLVVDGLAFVDGKLWVVRPAPEGNRGDVVSIDPATNRVTPRATIPRTFDVTAGGSHSLWYVRGTDLMRVDTNTLHTTIERHDVRAVLAAENLHLWLLTAAGVIETDELNGAEFGPPIRVTDTVNLSVAVSPDAVWIGGQPDSSTGGTVRPYDLVTHVPLAASVSTGSPLLSMSVVDNALWVDAGGVTRIPFSRGAAPRPAPTLANDDVLVFDDGYDGVVSVDPTARIAVRRVITGQRAGDQPFRSLLTAGTLVVGWDDVYAAPLTTGQSHFIGKGIVIPSESPGRVWLMPFGTGPATYRLVDLRGHVLLEGKGVASSTNEPVAIPGGLAFAVSSGVALWDARRDTVEATLGTSGAQPGISSGDTLAWCEHCRSDLRLTSTTTRVTHAVKLPSEVTGVDVADGRFSDDGRLLAIQVSIKGAADGAYAYVVVDVARGLVLRTVPAPVSYATVAWSPDGNSLYLASDSYQQGETTVRRADIASGRVTDTVLPFGGGITFQIVSRIDAGVLLDGPTTTAAHCAAPDIQPSDRTQPCRFRY